jgi:DNA-binding transcriptional LysR family regulator
MTKEGFRREGTTLFSTPYKYFLAVAKKENYHRASEELFVSQPAISKQIRLLEQTLGYALFKRTTRSVRLTAEGKLLYQALQECTFILESMQETIRYRLHTKIPTGPLKIGLLHGWDPHYFHIPFISNFQQKHKEVRLLYERHGHRELVKLLQENNLDIIIIPLDEILQENGLSFVYLGRYPFKIVISRKHPASQFDHIMDKLDDVPFYLHPHVHGGIPQLMETLDGMGIHSKVQLLPNLDSIFAATEAGEGFIMSLSCSRMCHQPDLRVYDLEGVDHHTDLVVAYKANINDSLVSLFIESLILLQASLEAQKKD